MKHLLTLSLATFLTIGSEVSDAGNCSTWDVAGKWVFATGVGRQSFAAVDPEIPIPTDKDITAIGTMNIGRDGYISGRFSVTFEDLFADTTPTYTGTIVVNKDCTANLSFVNSSGAERNDALVIINRSEMLGMSLDPNNLWTYQVRRIAPSLSNTNPFRRDDD